MNNNINTTNNCFFSDRWLMSDLVMYEAGKLSRKFIIRAHADPFCLPADTIFERWWIEIFHVAFVINIHPLKRYWNYYCIDTDCLWCWSIYCICLTYSCLAVPNIIPSGLFIVMSWRQQHHNKEHRHLYGLFNSITVLWSLS